MTTMRIIAYIAVMTMTLVCCSVLSAQPVPPATLQINAFHLPTEANQSPAPVVSEAIRVQIFHPNYIGGNVQRIVADRLQEQLNANRVRVPIVDVVLTTNGAGQVSVTVPLRSGQRNALLIVELQRADGSNQTTQRIDGLVVAAGATSTISVSVPEPLRMSVGCCCCPTITRPRMRCCR